MTRVQILLKPETFKKVKKISKERNISASSFVRDSVEKELAKASTKQTKTKDVLLKAALSAQKGGPKDLSSNDEYLYGAQ